ncbi:MAG: polysaccharide pyruvyl transferase family protein [Patescibacteria group bacterium]
MSNQPKKIIITDCFAHNSGDVGILMAMVAEIRREMPAVEIAIESTHPEVLRQFLEFDGLTIVPRIFDVRDYDWQGVWWRRLFVALRGSYDSVTFLLWAGLTRAGLNADFIVRRARRDQARLLRNVTAFISVGGGFLSSYYNYYFRLYVYLIGFLLGKQVLLLAQSVGPFETRTSRFLVPKFLERCAIITIREPNSFSYVRHLGLKTRCVQTADAAFLLAKKKAAWLDQLLATDRQTVAVALKYYSDPVKQQAFVLAIEAAIKYLQQQAYDILLVSQVKETDRQAAALIAAVGGRVRAVPFGVNPRELKELYAHCRFVVSGIMHPTIFAADSAVPFVAISYEPKLLGLLELLQYDERFMLDGQQLCTPSFPAQLIAAIKLLELERTAVANQLTERLPAVRALAHDNFKLLAEVIHT